VIKGGNKKHNTLQGFNNLKTAIKITSSTEPILLWKTLCITLSQHDKTIIFLLLEWYLNKNKTIKCT